MKKKHTIIEQAFGDNHYVKLDSNFDSKMVLAGIGSINLMESFNIGSPIMQIALMDGLGDLINTTYLSPDDNYDIHIGKSQEESETFSFNVSTTNMENSKLGTTDNMACMLTFIGSNWENMFKVYRSRSWTNVRISDVVKQIADETGYELTDIEPTFGKMDIIQPDWTNYQMLNWLTKQAVNEKQVAGYAFVVSLDNKLTFKTVDSFYDQKPNKAFYMVANTTGAEIFKNVNIKQEYVPILNQGGFGITAKHFDFNTKKFVSNEVVPSDLDQKQLTDWMLVSQGHEGDALVMNCGRDTNSKVVAQNKMTPLVNSVNKVDIVVEGDPTIHAGDLVWIALPNSEHYADLINEKYSGTWMVTKVTHNIDFQNQALQSDLTLIRSGINGVGLKGFVKTKTGKAIKK